MRAAIAIACESIESHRSELTPRRRGRSVEQVTQGCVNTQFDRNQYAIERCRIEAGTDSTVRFDAQRTSGPGVASVRVESFTA